ncbi:MAG: copper homeostasis protein CutC [Thermoflexibacter sp.]
MTLEICIDSVHSAIEAEKGGADRVELCNNLFEGGTTPSAGSITLCRKHIQIGLFVLIRPRGGDFLYSDLEFEIIKKDIKVAKNLGADGIVVGILKADGTIDQERMSIIMEHCHPLPVTFHRAFDMSVEPFQALEDIIGLGASRILTSGQERSAFEGTDLLADLVKKANQRIIIMAGGGVTERNIPKIHRLTGITEFHSSARKNVNSNMQYQQNQVSMGGELRMPEFINSFADAEKVRKMKELLL